MKLEEFLQCLKYIFTTPYTKSKHIDTAAKREFYAIEWNGRMLPESMDISQTNAMNRRTASWWAQQRDNARVCRYRVQLIDETPHDQ